MPVVFCYPHASDEHWICDSEVFPEQGDVFLTFSSQVAKKKS